MKNEKKEKKEKKCPNTPNNSTKKNNTSQTYIHCKAKKHGAQKKKNDRDRKVNRKLSFNSLNMM